MSADPVGDVQQSSEADAGAVPGARKKTLLFLCAFMGGMTALVGLIFALHPEPITIFAEHGLIESVSVGFWVLSVLTCLVTGVFLVRSAAWRWCFVWLFAMSGLAALRELDIHEVLNPETLGAWGVRYRIDWWIAADTSYAIRGLWLLVLLGVLFLVTYPIKRAKELWRPIWHNVSYMMIVCVGVACLATGYICDDILRGAPFISSDFKRAIEETAELLGASLLFCSIVVLARFAGKENGVRRER